ncbi:hypothetical protein U729_3092 (plasmid) [Clostridium baratii str. Sullivan]|uniref:Uncharacterized protein n=1 Tax=Clostridium baratii str. Sullivan TaxID=1415775 RepID=A0A0A7G2U1_9CLOT|nr:hypothetical protein [Clostridium baratii]AIY85335.1 hypothetical protein U729_3092 [Clostridium baratii str. Sullivan]
MNIANKKLDEEINRLYKKIEDGTMEQNSIELFTYMWLSELRDRRNEEDNINYYKADVYLNKNEILHFESRTKETLIDSVKCTLSDDRFKNDKVNEAYIYAVKQIDRLSCEELEEGR